MLGFACRQCLGGVICKLASCSRESAVEPSAGDDHNTVFVSDDNVARSDNNAATAHRSIQCSDEVLSPSDWSHAACKDRKLNCSNFSKITDRAVENKASKSTLLRHRTNVATGERESGITALNHDNRPGRSAVDRRVQH